MKHYTIGTVGLKTPQETSVPGATVIPSFLPDLREICLTYFHYQRVGELELSEALFIPIQCQWRLSEPLLAVWGRSLPREEQGTRALCWPPLLWLLPNDFHFLCMHFHFL